MPTASFESQLNQHTEQIPDTYKTAVRSALTTAVTSLQVQVEARFADSKKRQLAMNCIEVAVIEVADELDTMFS